MSFLSCIILALTAFQLVISNTRAAETGSLNRSNMRVNRHTLRLIPFPRVGRSRMAVSPFFAPLNFDNSQLLHVGTSAESEENPWDMLSALLFQKREGLIPFPRVGRSGTGPKRNGAGTSGSLWFGPRLGKRAYSEVSVADTNPTDNVLDYFNQNKVAFDDIAASVKAAELQ